jgi:hypothetical protein
MLAVTADDKDVYMAEIFGRLPMNIPRPIPRSRLQTADPRPITRSRCFCANLAVCRVFADVADWGAFRLFTSLRLTTLTLARHLSGSCCVLL